MKVACQNKSLFLALYKVTVGISDKHRALYWMPFQGHSFLSSCGSVVFNTWLPKLLPKEEKHGGSCWEVFMVQTWLPLLPPEPTGHHLFTRPDLTPGVPEMHCLVLTRAKRKNRRPWSIARLPLPHLAYSISIQAILPVIMLFIL